MVSIIHRITKRNLLFFIAHAVFWLGFILIPHIVMGIPFQYEFFEFKLLETSLLVCLFYLNAYLFVPKLLLAKKYVWYCILIATVIFGGMHMSKQFMPPKMPRNVVAFEIDNHPPVSLGEKVYRNDNKIYDNNHVHKKFKRIEQKRANFMGLLLLIIVSVSTGYRYALQMYKYERTMKDLQTAHVLSELQLMKSQMNPHFLFNTLNSIYSLSLKKSDDTPKAILQVSDMLRYITYDTNEMYVSLNKEVAYIQNYIALQKLRVSPDSIVSFIVEGEMGNKQVAPMVLLPFVENACKHGISSQGVLNMQANLLIDNDKIVFTVINTRYNNVKNSENNGIGIDNVRRRLQALYPNLHQLDISQTSDSYKVELTITI